MDTPRLTGNHFRTILSDGSVAMVDNFASDQLSIDVGGETILFELHEHHGPAAVFEPGAERYLTPSHRFWRAVSQWCLQGKRLNGTKAIWHEPQKPTL